MLEDIISNNWLILIFIIVLFYALYQRSINEIEKYYRRIIKELEDDYHQLQLSIKKERKDAIDSSRSTIKGQVSEVIAPWLMTCVNSVKELNFLGNPIDFVGFKGLDNKEEVMIKFIEVKTDKSSLSTKQRKVRDAVKAKRIEWVEVKIKTNDNISISENL